MTQEEETITKEAVEQMTTVMRNLEQKLYKYEGVPTEYAVYVDPNRVIIRKWKVQHSQPAWDVTISAKGIVVEIEPKIF